MIVFIIILLAIIGILFVPVIIFLLQVITACFAPNRRLMIEENKKIRPSITVLMPAHNESLVIAEPIQSILSQLETTDKLIVIADNCTDDTAKKAKALGATVLERFNETERGKGYALDYGIQYLKSDPTDVVIIVDADCLVQEQSIALLAASCVRVQRPMQALYLMESQPNPSLKERIATFAWVVKNKVRPLGFKILGLPCQLMGTGMAFLWADINRVNLASGHIVEDMKLGADLAQLNKAPIFLPEALVTSVFPPSEAAVNTQRARWEHGHLSVILNEGPKLIWGSIKHQNMQMFGLACDLLVPPLAMLALMSLVVFIASVVFGNGYNILLSSILLGCLFLAVMLAWAVFGREVISFKQLCYAPVYALIKIPLYIKFFLNRQVEWVRSKRD